jgi:UDP-glucose 4-epimerase
VNVLVVGGAGFIGSHLVERLLAEGHGVDVVDDLSSGSLGNLAVARAAAAGALKFHHLGVQADELDELFARREPQVVVHLAAVPRGLADRQVGEIAIGGTLNLLDAARRAGTAKVVVPLPARHLYGEVPARELPVKEVRPWEPITVRGVVARAVADLLTVYRSEHGVEFTALAMTNVYGARQRPGHGVVATMFESLARGAVPEVHGDGRQTRDFLYVDDAVDAVVKATDKGSGLVINIGTGVQTTIRDLYDAVAGPGRPAARFVTGRLEASGRFAVASVRARIHLAWAPWTSLATGLDTLRSAPGVSGTGPR